MQINLKNLLRQPVVIGNLAYFIARAINITLRIKIHASHNYDPNTQYLFAFWHGKQFLPVLQLHKHKTKRAVLVSPSRDGDLLSTWLHKLGYEVLRGSARDKNISSAIAMLRKLRQGYSLGFGIDGPKGPIYIVKPGMTYLAQKTKVAIIPVGSAYSKKWIFNRAWDKYQLPRPFAKAVLYLGDPITIDNNADLDAENTKLQAAIQQAELAAENLV